MRLGELIEKINNPMRLIVVSVTGEELYRGYKGNFDMSQHDDSEVTKVELYTIIEPKKVAGEILASTEGYVAMPDNITDMCFADLRHLIYQKITIRK